MEKHFVANSVRKRKVGVTQTCLEKLQEEDESSSNLPDILQTPSRRDTLSSFSSLYYTASEDSIYDASEMIQKPSFDIGKPDSNFYSGINCLKNDNLSIIVPDVEQANTSEDEKSKANSGKSPSIASIENYLDLGKKTMFATMKIVWVGDSGVGKTSLINVLMGNRFALDCRPTLGVDFATRLVPGPGDNMVKLQFWDFSGQDRFRILSRAYFKGAQGCLMVFDVSKRKSFEQLNQWERQLKDQDHHGECLTMVLANKNDLTSLVDDKEIEEFVANAGVIGWKRVSAVDGRGLSEFMDLLVKGMIRQEEIKRAAKEKNYYSCPDIFKLAESKQETTEKTLCSNC